MMLRQLFRFGLVGVLATALHMLVGVTLIHAGWPPLLANAVSFAIALLVSFTGHYGFTFPGHNVTLSTSLKRFVLVAGCSFMVNEALLAGLIRYSAISGMWGLVISTGTAATLTFLAGRNWAFRGSGQASSIKEHRVAGEFPEP